MAVWLLAGDAAAAAAAAIDGADDVMRCAAVCSPLSYYDQLTICDRQCDTVDRWAVLRPITADWIASSSVYM